MTACTTSTFTYPVIYVLMASSGKRLKGTYQTNMRLSVSLSILIPLITKFVEGFSKAKRFGDIKRCCRLGLKSDNPWNYPNRRDCFNFPVEKDVALHAITFSSLETKIKLTQ